MGKTTRAQSPPFPGRLKLPPTLRTRPRFTTWTIRTRRPTRERWSVVVNGYGVVSHSSSLPIKTFPTPIEPLYTQPEPNLPPNVKNPTAQTNLKPQPQTPTSNPNLKPQPQTPQIQAPNQSTNSKAQTAKHKQQSTNSKAQTAKHKQQSTNSKAQTAKHKQQSTNPNNNSTQTN